MTDARVEPRRYGRTRLRFYRGVERVLCAAGGRFVYRARHLAPGRFDVREERVHVADLPAGLADLRIAQLTDFHAGPFLGPGDLRDVVDAVNERAPHLIALTGDFVTHHWGEVERIVPDLARLRARCGIYAVFGNHDYKDRAEGRIAAALAGVGVRVLRNECARIEHAGATLALVGIEDVEEGRVVDLEGARRDVRPGDVEVVLCHNPRAAPAIARRGCAAVLSGHTHGTQVDLPFFRRFGPQHPGARVELGPTSLIVSRGLGAVGLPWRVGAPAEVVVCTLVAEAR